MSNANEEDRAFFQRILRCLEDWQNGDLSADSLTETIESETRALMAECENRIDVIDRANLGGQACETRRIFLLVNEFKL